MRTIELTIIDSASLLEARFSSSDAITRSGPEQEGDVGAFGKVALGWLARDSNASNRARP